jgi:hypothetical protein
MNEVGLVPFARVALQVGREVLPPYSHRFSPRRFSQPQLLAVLCLMRYEDWTFRAAEVRLLEHAELRRALELQTVPDHSTLFRFMLRLDEQVIAKALAEVVHRLQRRKAPPGPSQQRTIAVDATGLAPGSISTFFIRRREQHGGAPTPFRYWLKWLLAIDVSWRVIVAQKAHAGPTNDCATLPSLLNEIARGSQRIGVVVADAEFDSERNHQHIRQQLGAESIIPAKRSKAAWKLTGVRAQMRAHFPAERYRQRVQAETVFSVIKRKLSGKSTRSKPGHSTQAGAPAGSRLQYLQTLATLRSFRHLAFQQSHSKSVFRANPLSFARHLRPD